MYELILGGIDQNIANADGDRALDVISIEAADFFDGEGELFATEFNLQLQWSPN